MFLINVLDTSQELRPDRQTSRLRVVSTASSAHMSTANDHDLQAR